MLNLYLTVPVSDVKFTNSKSHLNNLNRGSQCRSFERENKEIYLRLFIRTTARSVTVSEILDVKRELRKRVASAVNVTRCSRTEQ